MLTADQCQGYFSYLFIIYVEQNHGVTKIQEVAYNSCDARATVLSNWPCIDVTEILCNSRDVVILDLLIIILKCVL